MNPRNHRTPQDLSAEYLQRDLHTEGVWEVAAKARYGLVVFDGFGQVLLRKPAGHFDGYHWTFSKGNPDDGEHPVDTATRETFEETGRRPVIIGHMSEGFGGTGTGSKNFYYLAYDDAGPVDPRATEENAETALVRWVVPTEARELIGQSTNVPGRKRDLQTLDAALVAFADLAD